MLPYAALESLGFGSYITEVKDVLQECKTVALKRRKASSRLENLGIPEEELLRQQQELFAKVGINEGNNIKTSRFHCIISSPAFTFQNKQMIHFLFFKCGCSHGVFDICREDSDNSVTAYLCIKMHPNVHVHVLV